MNILYRKLIRQERTPHICIILTNNESMFGFEDHAIQKIV